MGMIATVTGVEEGTDLHMEGTDLRMEGIPLMDLRMGDTLRTMEMDA